MLSSDPDQPLEIEYEQTNIDKLENPADVESSLQMYAEDSSYHHKFVRLAPYINRSAMTVEGDFSLQRTFIIFRALGLRHLFVTDEQNRVLGTITRKDLMTSSIQERLADRLRQTLYNHAHHRESNDSDLSSAPTTTDASRVASRTATHNSAHEDNESRKTDVTVNVDQDAGATRSASSVLAASYDAEQARRGELMLELNEHSSLGM